MAVFSSRRARPVCRAHGAARNGLDGYAPSVDDAVEGADLRHTNVGDNIPISSADRGTHTLHAKPTLPHAELKNSVHENMAAPTLTPRSTRARDTTRNTADGEGRFERAWKGATF